MRDKWKEGGHTLKGWGGLSVLEVMLVNKFSVLHSIDREGRGLCSSAEKEKEQADQGEKGKRDSLGFR